MMHIKSTAMQVQKGGVVYSGDKNCGLAGDLARAMEDKMI